MSASLGRIQARAIVSSTGNSSADDHSELEFWAGQPSRLHDRFRYSRPKDGEGKWDVNRLAP